jgi:hypothetical protein
MVSLPPLADIATRIGILATSLAFGIVSLAILIALTSFEVIALAVLIALALGAVLTFPFRVRWASGIAASSRTLATIGRYQSQVVMPREMVGPSTDVALLARESVRLLSRTTLSHLNSER